MEGSFLGSFIVLFRESFEAALVVGIVLSFLTKTNNQQFFKTVWSAVGVAIIASIGLAALFNMLTIQFEGQTEYVFEGITMLVTALLLATLIVYMMRANVSTKAIENQASTSIMGGSTLGLFALIFFSVFREGVESVLFFVKIDFSILGGLVGLLVGIGLVYAVFAGIVRLNFKMLFNVTNALLILIASGLVAHGVHELQEAGWIPIINEHVWDMNHILNEKGNIGEILKGVFGYNGNPSLIEVISYWVFMLGVIAAGKLMPASKPSPKS